MLLLMAETNQTDPSFSGYGESSTYGAVAAEDTTYDEPDSVAVDDASDDDSDLTSEDSSLSEDSPEEDLAVDTEQPAEDTDANDDSDDNEPHEGFVATLVAKYPGTGDHAWDKLTIAERQHWLRSEAAGHRVVKRAAGELYPDAPPAVAILRTIHGKIPRSFRARLGEVSTIGSQPNDFAAMSAVKQVAPKKSDRDELVAVLEMLGSPVGNEFDAMPGADIAAAAKKVNSQALQRHIGDLDKIAALANPDV